MKIQITATRDIKNMPYFYETLPEQKGFDVAALKAADGTLIPVQKDSVGGKDGYTVMLNLEKGKTYTYELVQRASIGNKVVLSDDKTAKTVGISIDGHPFTTYSYTDAINKPYMGNFSATKKDGTKVDFLRLDLTAKEHPHQRALFVGVGDVNGLDFWNENGDWGKQLHEKFNSFVSGPVFAYLSAKNVWKDLNGKPYVDEQRSFKIYDQGEDFRCVDESIKFTASYGKVVFGQTKEAGPLGVRLSEALNGDHGGMIKNSYGAEHEKECWSRFAHWCDYYNTVDGEAFGVAIFDNPSNILYPTAFHVREYGLFAPNNLFFKSAVTIEDGASVEYKFRIVFHKCSTEDAGIQNAYLNYLGNGADVILI